MAHKGRVHTHGFHLWGVRRGGGRASPQPSGPRPSRSPAAGAWLVEEEEEEEGAQRPHFLWPWLHLGSS